MDKNGLGPVLDENGNVKCVLSRDDKIKVFTDTLIEAADPNAGKARDHVAIDMFDVVAGLKGVEPEFRPRAIPKPRQGAEKLRMHHVCVSANECVDLLERIRRRLARFAQSRDQMGRENDPDSAQLAELSGQIMTLAREAFVPAHSLCSAVIGLYMTEDYIREPNHGEFPDYNEGRIRIPSKRTNRKTLLQLHMCIDTATEFYAKFQPGPRFGITDRIAKFETEEMKSIVVMLRQMMQELYATGSGCFDLLNILLYIDPPEQDAFTGFLNNLSSMEKSDLLEGISRLRRTVDQIPLLLEKLSWASYAVYRLATGQESPTDSGAATPVSVSSGQFEEAAGTRSSKGQPSGILLNNKQGLNKKASENRIVRDNEAIDQRQGQRSKGKERTSGNESPQVTHNRDRESRPKERKDQNRKKEGNSRR